MIKAAFLSLLALVWFYSATAQEIIYKKPKVFEAWIRVNNSPYVSKGILWLVGDSSIFISMSLRDTSPKEYHCNEIEMLKIRRSKSILWGTVAGGSVGMVSGIVAVRSITGDLGYMKGPMTTIAGLYFGTVGAGLGILAGSIKDRIPIRSNYVNFEKFRGNLVDYSFLREETGLLPRFEHRIYAGANIGFSFAMDEFASAVPVTGYQGMDQTGYYLRINTGYRFTEHLGANFSLINNSFPVGDFDQMSNWTFDAFLVNPVVSLPLSGKFRIDLSPGIGYALTSLYSDGKYVLNGDGFGWNVNGLVSYNYAKRWFASASAGYLSSEVTYEEGGRGEAHCFNVGIGLAYKFGGKSL